MFVSWYCLTTGACSDNTGQTQILQPPSRARHYQSSSHKLLQLFSICVYNVGIPSIVFWSLATEIKENLLDIAHLADEIYSSHSKEN